MAKKNIEAVEAESGAEVMTVSSTSDVTEEAAVQDVSYEPASGSTAGQESSEKEYPAVLVYIGPTIFRTSLISGRVFITHGSPIDDILTDELRKYPLARQMFVTPGEAAEALKKIHDTGTALGNAYKQLSGG